MKAFANLLFKREIRERERLRAWEREKERRERENVHNNWDRRAGVKAGAWNLIQVFHKGVEESIP